MQKLRIITAILLFAAFVVLLEGNGYIIHKLHYDTGASWSNSVLVLDNNIKIALYQLVIFTLIFVHKKLSLFMIMEVFWWTCTQDIFFYLIWNNGIFPTGDLSWLPMYNVLGIWLIEMQILFSITLISLSVVISVLLERELC